MRGIFTIFILLMVVGLMFMGQEVRDTKGSEYSIDEKLSQMQWNYNYNMTNNTVTNAANKFVDAFGYSFIGIAKGSYKFGFNHPEYDFKMLFDFIKSVLIFIVLLAFIPAVPYLLGFLYILFLGLKKLVLFIKKKNTLRK